MNNIFELKQFKKGNKIISFFGSMHGSDKEQLLRIKEELDKLNPEIVLIEGNYDIPIYASEEEAIQKGRELGFVSNLSRKKKIPLISNDPKNNEEIQFIQRVYTRDISFIYLVLRNYNQNRKSDLSKIINSFKKDSGWQEYDYSLDNFKETFLHLFKEQFNQDKDYSEYFNPLNDLNIFNQVTRDLSNFRDNYLLGLLKRVLKKYNRIFIIKGKYHLNKLKKRIEQIL